MRLAISHAATGRLPERRRSAEDAFVAGSDPRDGLLLKRSKLALELCLNRCARVPFIPHFGPDLVRFEKCQSLRQTPTRHRDMLDEFLAAGYHAGFIVRREPHRLRLVKLRVLKGCQPEQPIEHGWRQILTFHVNKVRANDLNGLRQRSFDQPLPPFA